MNSNGHTDYINSVAFSPNGGQLASASDDKTVRLWNVATGTEIRQFQGHTDWVTSVAFSPDGTKLASASHDKTVRLWDVTTGTQIRQFLGHTFWVMSVAFSPDGEQLASASEDETIRLWDAATGQCICQFLGHTYSVTSVAFSPDGNQLAASWDETVCLWNFTTRKITTRKSIVNYILWNRPSQEIRQFQGHTHRVTSVAFSHDGSQLATASWDKTVRLWDVATGTQIHQLLGHTDRVRSVAFSPNGGQLASASYDKTVRLWDVVTGTEIYQFIGHTAPIMSVAFSPDGEQLASASDDKTVRLWDVATSSQIIMIGTPLEESVQCDSDSVNSQQCHFTNVIDLESTCTICLDLLITQNIQNKIVTLPCNHHFHQGCINGWFNRQKWCPICKRTFFIAKN